MGFTNNTLSSHLFDTQNFLPNSTSRVALLVFVNIPVFAILLNVRLGLAQRPVVTPGSLPFHTLHWIRA